MKPVEITRETFVQEVLESELPVLIDFWAGWCGPCRMVAPVVDEIAEDYDGRLKVGKVDVDAQPELAAAFGVSGIPMLAVVQNQAVVARKVGAAPRRVLEADLELERLTQPPAAA